MQNEENTNKNKSSISNATSYEEMAEFWDEHDATEFGEQIEFRLFGNRIVDILVKILDRLSLSFGACLQGCTSHLWVLTS